MICPSFADPKYLIWAENVPPLLYYSHLTSLIVSLFLGIFVYFKSHKSLLGKILLFISISFFIWVFLSLITWTNNNSNIIIFVWSFFGILYGLLYILSIYFVHVFVEGKDITFSKKSILFALMLPLIIATPTYLNLRGFNLDLCGSVGFEGQSFIFYETVLGIIAFVWILIYLILKHRKAERDFKKQIVFLGIGIEAFLFSFFITGFLASYLTDKGIISDFGLEFYGLFGMTLFMGFLAYLIVKYKAFNIKLLGAQALVVALVVLIGSEFFFISFDNTTNVILISVTVLLAVVFGIFLINSVKKEVQRKEELQLMSNKLAQANDKLRQMDNTKSEFISIASHQLRTPLTAIKGFISLLLEGSYGKLESKQEEALNKTYTSTERLINLVEDLLNISRMESGRMEFKFAPAKMEDLCQEIIDTFVLRAKEKDLYLNYKKPEMALPELMIDAGKVKEIVSNMVDNALKYTPKGGVTLRLEQVSDAVRVIVSDTGIGIPATELPYLFNKFSRGKDIGRLNAGGTGLGLYVGKGMIENNGGRIWAESDGGGKGSRFIIELPINQSEELLERWG